MRRKAKTGHLQIRVSPSQKLAIKKQADRAQMTMSEWILDKLLPSSQTTFAGLVNELAVSDKPSFVFAELLELIAPMDVEEYQQAVSTPPEVELDPYWQTYLAATLEHAAVQKGADVPHWAQGVGPLKQPAFGSSLKSLKLHLLINSPPAFAGRNIFIDSSVGDRA